MDKRHSFRKFDSTFERKAKMAERQQIREIRERSKLNTDAEYMDWDESDDWQDDPGYMPINHKGKPL